jgi:uncharacterized membrane protein
MSDFEGRAWWWMPWWQVSGLLIILGIGVAAMVGAASWQLAGLVSATIALGTALIFARRRRL